MATKRKIDRDTQSAQFRLLADSIERQLASHTDDRHHRATVYVLVRHVSRSGMRRIIDFKVVDADGDLLTLTLVGQDVYRYDYDRNGYVVDGCGMDMGFALTDSIMYQLLKWCKAERCNLALAADLHVKGWQDIIRHRVL